MLRLVLPKGSLERAMGLVPEQHEANELDVRARRGHRSDGDGRCQFERIPVRPR